MRSARRLLLVLVPIALAGCAGGTEPPVSVVRDATAAERARVVLAVERAWQYESEPSLPWNPAAHRRLHRPPLHPSVLRIRVSRADPRFSLALVRLRDAGGTARKPATLMLFRRLDDASLRKLEGALLVDGPAQDFPHACTSATPRGIRDLLCPDPWAVVSYPRPTARVQTALNQPIPSSDLHRIDWSRVALPGGACSSSRTIRPQQHRWYGKTLSDAYIDADVEFPWWNPVIAAPSSRPILGDLDGDGRDEAALNVTCANGGGTAAGQLAFSSVIFRADGRSLHVLGVLGPQQPLLPQTPHVPLMFVSRIEPGRVVTSESRYGPADSDCCPSGRAQTTWTYANGRLRPTRTVIVRAPSR